VFGRLRGKRVPEGRLLSDVADAAHVCHVPRLRAEHKCSCGAVFVLRDLPWQRKDDESPFAPCETTEGYPFDERERAAQRRVIAAKDARRWQPPPADPALMGVINDGYRPPKGER
jgi:hypothetical protein